MSTERYERGEVIGRGAHGEVRRGRDRDLDRDVAIKVLDDVEADRPELARRLIDEARLGGRLQHPGVLPIYDLGEDANGRPFVVMRLVVGERLEDRLARRASPTEDRHGLLRIFVQVCQTVAYAHGRGVVHGDVRAEHVRIGDFGEVHVLEWGRVAADADGPDPERADDIGLGRILYRIVTGAPPAAGTPPDAPVDEPALAELCRRSLGPRPQESPTTARDLADGVETHLAAAEDRAHRARVRAAKARAEAEDQRRRRRHLVVVIVAVLVLLGAAGLTVRAIERERIERDRRTAAAVGEALETATIQRAAGDEVGAEAAAERALDLLGEEHGRRRRLAATLLAEIREARENARLRVERERRDAVLLERLEVVRSRGQASPEEVESSVRAAFRERGLELAAEAMGELRASTRAEPLAASLVACASSIPAEGPDLGALADEVDPEARRVEIRAIVRSGDATRLRELARAGGIPPSLAGLVGRTLAEVDRAAGEAFLRQAWFLAPGDPWTGFELAVVLAGRSGASWSDVLRFASAAAALRPRNPTFRVLAGRAMLMCRDVASARLTARELVSRFPDFAPGHALTGLVRFDRGDLDGAIEAYREAICLDESLAQAHGQLAAALLRRGRFAEALEEARRAEELGGAHPGWRRDAASVRLVADCQRFLTLAKSLPDIVAGRRRPAGMPETAAFARLCRSTDHPATAARLYRSLYRSKRGGGGRRYPRREGPIECAALAGVGRGRDADTLDEAERATWRAQALAWMTARRDDLARTPGRQSRGASGAVVGTLRRWLVNPNYAGVREPEALSKLPERERAAWQAFWTSIEERIEQFGGW